MEVQNQMPSKGHFAKGPVAIFECLQQIPCNPCADACPRGAITVKEINDCPTLDEELCNGCGVCMTHCPGLSIFVVDYNYEKDAALVKIPYEFLPLPEANDVVGALNRKGECVGRAKVVRVQKSPNKTSVIWLSVPPELAADIRAIQLEKEGNDE
jgi:Fe-S-cluster-containing hydrogenase component 2